MYCIAWTYFDFSSQGNFIFQTFEEAKMVVDLYNDRFPHIRHYVKEKV
jgi:hypothetical protein